MYDKIHRSNNNYGDIENHVGKKKLKVDQHNILRDREIVLSQMFQIFHKAVSYYVIKFSSNREVTLETLGGILWILGGLKIEARVTKLLRIFLLFKMRFSNN